MTLPTTFVQQPTPLSTVSSSVTTNTANVSATVQSGPYTKAQFQNTMEGSRSVKNGKEIEQLLRDYPAALELYRTGRYKVKLKNEGEVERVILVEKRSNKNTSTSSNPPKTTESQQQNKLTVSDITNTVEKKKEDSKKDRSRSRTHSRDRVATRAAAVPDNNPVVQTTTSSMRVPSNTQPKVDNHRTASKERDISITSQSKQQQQPPPPAPPQTQLEQSHRRSHSRDSHSKTSHVKHRGRKGSRDYQNALVPYVPNVNPPGNIWHQTRALQPYFSNPLLPHPGPMSNLYLPSPFVSQPYPGFQQPYYYGQPPYAPPPLTYQNSNPFTTTTSTNKSGGTINNKTLPAVYNYPPPSQPGFNPNQGVNLPPSSQTFHPSQPQYTHPQAMYHPNLPFQIPVGWPTPAARPLGPLVNNNNMHIESRQNSTHRARSVDTGPYNYPPGHFNNQQPQPAPVVTEHYRHHRHHHRSHPINAQVVTNGPSAEARKDPNALLKETTAAAAAAMTTANNGEKLTIRQLNEIFLRTDPSGRLPYASLPNILQRFGIALTENDLTSAAKSLDYNTNEPLSARRLVHVLVNLGKIAKSNQRQRLTASPVILPEDREVNDIMTQRRVPGAQSTHIHSSAFPNQWY